MSDGVKGLREARVAATEEQILAAARELFVRNGYHATTLTEVADAAGVGHRTVYLRFGTKAALLKRFGSVQRLRLATIEQIAEVSGFGGKAAAELKAFLEAREEESSKSQIPNASEA